MIISISGDAGSGKSTIAKMLAKKLGMKHYYIGAMRRDMAKKENMTLEQFNAKGEKHEYTDIDIDNWQKKLGATQDNFIIEGRTSYHFIPHSRKIYLKVNEQEGARRIWSDIQNGTKRNEAKNLKSIDDVLISNQKRKKSDNRRYKKYYNIDTTDISHYNYIYNTTNKTIDETFNELYTFITSRKQ